MIDESLLPVGSCVKIANNSKMIMIAGYLPYDNQDKEIYDYLGLYTPIGIRNPRQSIALTKDYICLNNSDIEKTLFLGYSDKESDFYCKYLLNIKNRLNNIKKDDLTDENIKRILRESLPNIRDIKN